MNSTDRFQQMLDSKEGKEGRFAISLVSRVTNALTDIGFHVEDCAFEDYYETTFCVVADISNMPRYYHNCNSKAVMVFNMDDSIIQNNGNGYLSGFYRIESTVSKWIGGEINIVAEETPYMCCALKVKDYGVKYVTLQTVFFDLDEDQAEKQLLISSEELKRSYEIVEALGMCGVQKTRLDLKMDDL